MSETAKTLGDLAEFVRAKNAGPFWVTLDVFLRDEPAYRRATEQHLITPEVISRLYDVPAGTVQVFELPSLQVVKVSFPRAVSQGSVRDRDMHAGQQHVPLASMPLA
ncbi:DUF4387 domain-containing protein [Patulibacter sp. S7RM1-6]